MTNDAFVNSRGQPWRPGDSGPKLTAGPLTNLKPPHGDSELERLGVDWVRRYNIAIVEPTPGARLRGLAFVNYRRIITPWPTTTRDRLYILAHEIAHVVLDHRRQLPRYVQEYEAEQFAHTLLRRAGVKVSKKMTHRARRYVWNQIAKAIRRGARSIDPQIIHWTKQTPAKRSPGIASEPPGKRRRYYARSMARVHAAIARAENGNDAAR